ncbi:hypothetical protein QBC47DRAFT_435932 [Echria macrotheca]|uniref:Uncharacterized protein n=1 Tax=Echria macrotheca TaxID=438768 RepID=A0AAJ0BI99_9PEZI|nr:hypothetical protein QBC47DRAFT_435932 [Echria macrotheca]
MSPSNPLVPLPIEAAFAVGQQLAAEAKLEQTIISKTLKDASRLPTTDEKHLIAEIVDNLRSAAAMVESNQYRNAALSPTDRATTVQNIRAGAGIYEMSIANKATTAVDVLRVAVGGNGFMGSVMGVVLSGPDVKQAENFDDLVKLLVETDKKAKALSVSLATLKGFLPHGGGIA